MSIPRGFGDGDRPDRWSERPTIVAPLDGDTELRELDADLDAPETEPQGGAAEEGTSSGASYVDLAPEELSALLFAAAFGVMLVIGVLVGVAVLVSRT